MAIEKNALARYYERHHRKTRKYGFSYLEQERGRIFKEWIGRGKRVLDLGCRDGTLTRHYSDGNKVVGVDIDKVALKICKRRLGIDTRWLDMNREFPFECESFDVIVSGEVIEHVFSIEHVLKEIRRTLVPGGIFVGSTPNAFHILERLSHLFARTRFPKSHFYHFKYALFGINIGTVSGEMHVNDFSLQRLKTLLKSYFDEVSILGIGARKSIEILSGKLPALFALDFVWKCVK